ncbi:hypothetical protein O181_014168 [Austropuccinia psidii MF-1]|uniref:Uncharacterized protein n=1 Tax=Austropuccinia psidii MF-1 TaxID=1389203 RepID=A0A9Q3C021_9BASI|nr:hypothetical protein [Austropuccinia psidii MF-1]
MPDPQTQEGSVAEEEYQASGVSCKLIYRFNRKEESIQSEKGQEASRSHQILGHNNHYAPIKVLKMGLLCIRPGSSPQLLQRSLSWPWTTSMVSGNLGESPILVP